MPGSHTVPWTVVVQPASCPPDDPPEEPPEAPLDEPLPPPDDPPDDPPDEPPLDDEPLPPDEPPLDDPLASGAPSGTLDAPLHAGRTRAAATALPRAIEANAVARDLRIVRIEDGLGKLGTLGGLGMMRKLQPRSTPRGTRILPSGGSSTRNQPPRATGLFVV